MSLFKLFHRNEPRAPSTGDVCPVHGWLGSGNSYGGVIFSAGSAKPFCPKCLGEWLVRNFPVERKERSE